MQGRSGVGSQSVQEGVISVTFARPEFQAPPCQEEIGCYLLCPSELSFSFEYETVVIQHAHLFCEKTSYNSNREEGRKGLLGAGTERERGMQEWRDKDEGC